MQRILLAAAVGLALSTGMAFAGEGNGDPFPFRAPGVTSVTADQHRLPGRSQDPFPFRGNDAVHVLSAYNELLVSNGAQGIVQTANSLPVGFASGTAAFEQSRTVMAFLQRESERQIAVIQMAQEKTRAAGKAG